MKNFSPKIDSCSSCSSPGFTLKGFSSLDLWGCNQHMHGRLVEAHASHPEVISRGLLSRHSPAREICVEQSGQTHHFLQGALAPALSMASPLKWGAMGAHAELATRLTHSRSAEPDRRPLVEHHGALV